MCAVGVQAVGSVRSVVGRGVRGRASGEFLRMEDGEGIGEGGKGIGEGGKGIGEGGKGIGEGGRKGNWGGRKERKKRRKEKKDWNRNPQATHTHS